MGVYLFVVLVGLFGVGTAQQCENNSTLVRDGADLGVIDTTAPYCFICLTTPDAISFGGMPFTNTTNYFYDPNINIFVISNWTGLNFLYSPITVECRVTVGITDIVFSGTFFSSIPGPLIINGDPFFVEGSTVSVTCFNQNRNRLSGFTGDPQWRAPNGTNIGSVSELLGIATLSIPSVTRGSAGTYRCVVPTAPNVPASDHELIIHYAPEVSIESAPNRTEETGRDFNLDCSFIGIPQPDVTWTLNDTVIDSNSASVTITNTLIDPSIRSVLTVMNVTPATARGRYQCLLNNSAGVANETYNIWVASSPAPADTFVVDSTTSTSIALMWTVLFDGLADVTGARLDYFNTNDTAESPGFKDVNGFSGNITGLTPFAHYNVSVSLRNRLGLSDPVSLVQQTESEFLAAPGVSLIADSSTQLTLSWMAPPPNDRVQDAMSWRWEFMSMDGTDSRSMTVDANVLSVVFNNLSKGTEYRATVTGLNSRGAGETSPVVTNETLVDPPGAPQGLDAVGLSSFAVRLNWTGPVDNGGRPVIYYVITLSDTMGNMVYSTRYSVNANPMLNLLINNMTLLMQNTTYNVFVAAENVAGVGDNITRSVRTMSIDQPQPLLEPPSGSEVTNISATVTWPFPGGDVNFYLITLTERVSGEAMNFIVNETAAAMRMLVLEDLKPATTYEVTITISNDMGFSMVSPLTSFTTIDPPPPTISAYPDTQRYQTGTTVLLTCSTVDGFREIKWDRLDGYNLTRPGFTFSNTSGMSNLTITDLREDNAGTYRCRVGNTMADFELIVFTPITEPPTSAGLSTTTIIIIAVVAGAGTLILIGLVVVIIVLCVCCKGGDGTPSKSRRSGGFSPKKKGGKDLFEISSNFTPTTNTGITRESNVTFDMPEDFQTHSSFNTMEKQKIERSSSPDVAQPTSFGGGQRTSTDGLMNEYQVPTSSDGTML